MLKQICASLLLVVSIPVFAAGTTMTREQCTREFTPRSGQKGKDVIWVPTLDEVATAMLQAARVGPRDLVFDLGSGDGKIPIAAAKHFGARAVGIEYNPKLVELAQCYVRAEGLGGKVDIVHGDIFETDFSRATVLTLYLLPELNERLRPTILRMKPGTRIVSNTFKMGDWEPDQAIEPSIGNTYAYLWIVPALVDGTWELRDPANAERFRITLAQRYQYLQGTPARDASREVLDGKLQGKRIELQIANGPRILQLQGDVLDDTMQLTSVEPAPRTFIVRRLR